MSAKTKRGAVVRYSDEPVEVFLGPTRATETAVIASLMPPRTTPGQRKRDEDAALKNVGTCTDCGSRTIDTATGHHGLRTTWFVRCTICGYKKNGVSR